jgi:hypothetical protein
LHSDNINRACLGSQFSRQSFDESANGMPTG